MSEFIIGQSLWLCGNCHIVRFMICPKYSVNRQPFLYWHLFLRECPCIMFIGKKCVILTATRLDSMSTNVGSPTEMLTRGTVGVAGCHKEAWRTVQKASGELEWRSHVIKRHPECQPFSSQTFVSPLKSTNIPFHFILLATPEISPLAIRPCSTVKCYDWPALFSQSVSFSSIPFQFAISPPSSSSGCGSQLNAQRFYK